MATLTIINKVTEGLRAKLPHFIIESERCLSSKAARWTLHAEIEINEHKLRTAEESLSYALHLLGQRDAPSFMARVAELEEAERQLRKELTAANARLEELEPYKTHFELEYRLRHGSITEETA